MAIHPKFAPTDRFSLLTAPSQVRRPTGRALSPERIELHWTRPTHPNGILNPYRVTCLDTTSRSVPISVLTENGKTTSMILDNMYPGAIYRCQVTASTRPRERQDPEECKSVSELSDPIKTKPASAFDSQNDYAPT